MSMTLPNVLFYDEPIFSLPDATKKTNIVLNPSNSQGSYTAGNMIIFDFPQAGYLDPQSLHIRYKMTINSTCNANGSAYHLCGTPVYTPFLREEIIINSNVVENINNYNQVHNMMTNLKYSVAQKYGVAPSFGYSIGETVGVAPSLEALDGRYQIGTVSTAITDNFYMSAPLPCLFSYSKKMIPLQFMGSVRIQLILDSISNMFSSASDLQQTPASIPLPSSYSISNIELVYDMLEFNTDVDQIVRKNEKIYIKSQSFSNTQQTLSATQGNISMVFNTRLASIKSAFLNLSSTDSAKCTNKLYDSVDISKNNGDFTLNIGGNNYPQRALSTLNNKGGIFQALRDAIDPIFDNHNSLSISRNEWNFTDSQTTTILVPGKFYVGFNLEKLHSNSLLTGISSTQTAINVLLNLGTVMTAAANINLILNYDVLLEIDLVNRQCAIKQ